MTAADPATPAEFFEGDPVGADVHAAVTAVIHQFGEVEQRVGASQVSFRRRRGFVYLWRPDRWLHGDVAPVVLSIALLQEDTSPRWKEVVHPSPAVWMHHLEVRDPAEIDAEVVERLREAPDAAG